MRPLARGVCKVSFRFPTPLLISLFLLSDHGVLDPRRRLRQRPRLAGRRGPHHLQTKLQDGETPRPRRIGSVGEPTYIRRVKAKQDPGLVQAGPLSKTRKIRLPTSFSNSFSQLCTEGDFHNHLIGVRDCGNFDVLSRIFPSRPATGYEGIFQATMLLRLFGSFPEVDKCSADFPHSFPGGFSWRWNRMEWNPISRVNRESAS